MSQTVCILLYLASFCFLLLLNPSNPTQPSDSKNVYGSVPFFLKHRRLRASLLIGCILLIVLASHILFGESTKIALSFEILSDAVGIALWFGTYLFDKAKTDFYNETGIYVYWPNRYSYSPGPNKALKESKYGERASRGIKIMLSACFCGLFGFFIILASNSPSHHNRHLKSAINGAAQIVKAK